MIRALLRLAEWLDKRFPPKVVVTQAEYDALSERLRRQARAIEGLAAEVAGLKGAPAPADTSVTDRLTDLEAKFADLAKALAKPKQTDSEVMRAAFLRGEFPRTANRAELEAQAK